jgi:CRP/FNR family transcriptional regulator, cyclic AMP receptor protein
MASPDAYTRAAKSGEVIFSAGDAGSDLFIIEEGRVELAVASPPRTFTLEVGDFFGERALVYDQRDATAKALTACRLLRLDRDTFTAVVKVHPEIALLMLRSLPRESGQAPAGAVPTGGVLVHATSNARFPLDKPDMLIGRSSQASGYAADIDLSGHDPDKTLSRKHARVTRSNEGVFLKEEEGRNGTFVNGTRVGPGQTVRLEEGDRIRFGLVEVVFRSA